MSEPRRGDVAWDGGEYLLVLECPCCGSDGAYADADGRFWDGQATICGCYGHVMVDGDEDEEPQIWVDEDCPCRSERPAGKGE